MLHLDTRSLILGPAGRLYDADALAPKPWGGRAAMSIRIGCSDY
jgi:hypothetical protein